MKKTVTILLSTYNGEKYLEEQLQSLFNQTYWENCTLFVRDDGSKDGTIDILKKYEKENKLILNCGENIGFVKSFFWLLNNAPKADFYSFCDQDDVWFEDKIARAVSMLSEKDLNNPQLYFSDYDFYSSNLKFISTRSTSKKTPSFYEALTDCRAAGFTILINTPFLDELKKINENRELKCSFCGKPQSQVKRLISGSGVYICNECVDLCSSIVEDDYDEENERESVLF